MQLVQCRLQGLGIASLVKVAPEAASMLALWAESTSERSMGSPGQRDKTAHGPGTS